MKSLGIARKVLSPSTKSSLIKMFPSAYRIYERLFLLHTLKLNHYYNRSDDSLHIGKAVLPMSIICSPEFGGCFNPEYADIVQPYATKAKVTDFLEGPYEVGEVKLDKGDIVFDCGANLGLFSAMSANMDCVSYAFEPMEENIQHLDKIIRVNPNIILSPYAVSDMDGTVQFKVQEGFSVSASITQTNDNTTQTININTITLDTFVEKYAIRRVDFIKADIEGAERLLLKGAKNVLKKFAPKLSLCTYHLPDDPQVLRELILEANPEYKIFEKYKKIYAYVPNRVVH